MKSENLRTLMLFGEYLGSFCEPFGNMFREAKTLRVIFLSGASYDVEDLFPSFSQLVHLRYLRIKGTISSEKSLSRSISRFYNLQVLDIKRCYGFGSTREISNLVKIRHFVVGRDMYHSGIYEVGKLKNIQELRRFEVKRDKHGFELNQLGQLLQLQGSLEIHNLAKVKVVTEADEAKLAHMHYLKRLLLDWGSNGSDRDMKKEEDVLERLKPHSNQLRELCIRGHGGRSYPSWLGTDHSIENLECLCLDGVAWKSLPLLGEFLMVGEERPCIVGQIFNKLKRVELVNIHTLKKWTSSSPFSHLEELVFEDCHELIELPFTHYTSPQAQPEKNITLFPKLKSIHVSNCAKLESVPKIPWTSGLDVAILSKVGTSIEYIYYKKDQQYINVQFRDDALERDLWNVLDFSKLREIKRFEISHCPPIPLDHLQMVHLSKVLLPTEGEDNARFEFSVEHLSINRCDATGKELVQLVSYFPNLSYLSLCDCTKQPRGAEETQDAEEGLLPLPLQIKELTISHCPDVRLCSSMLQSQSSLRSLTIRDCPKLLSSISGSSLNCPFPISLQYLNLANNVKEDMFELAPLTNLTELGLMNCGGLRSEDLWRLLAQGCLKELYLSGASFDLFNGSELSRMHERDLPHRPRVQKLETAEEGGTVADPIRSHFSSSLTTLDFSDNSDMENFTREQSEALQMLASLQELKIRDCPKLQSLAAGLNGLPNLKRIYIGFCESIRSLPKGGLPSSLTKLYITNCSAIRSLPKGTLPSSLMELTIQSCGAFRSLPKDSLPSSLTKLVIVHCPAIRSLHKGSLPNSLQTLIVRGSNKKLQNQCRKLRGTIPVVIID